MPMEEILFVPLTEDLLSPCADLYMDTFSREPWLDQYDSREQVEAFFRRYWENPWFLGYAALEGEKPVGLCLGFQKPWMEGMEYWIDEFCIGWQLQGRGLGSRFLGWIRSQAQSQGLNALILNTQRGSMAQEFYEKNGLVPLEDQVMLAQCWETGNGK